MRFISSGEKSMNKNKRYSLTGYSVRWLIVSLYVFCINPSFAQHSRFGSSFEGGRGLTYLQSARTIGNAQYAIGLQTLAMQREYFVLENNRFRIPTDNTTVIGLPVTVGITDFLDLSAGFYFFHDARPYRNESDIYQYHHSRKVNP